MFTILVSALNCDKYLENCLQSIIYSNVKCDIILINPKPSKGYNEIKKKFNHNIYHAIEDSDEGCADGLNKALKFVNNPYVCVLNGDDYFLKDNLDLIVQATKSNADIIIGNGYIVDANGFLIKEFKSTKFSINKMILNLISICHQATFYKNKIFQDGIRFNKNNTTSWDSEILLDVYLKDYNFKYIDDYISAFRIHKSSISGQAKNKKNYKLQKFLYFEKIKKRQINILDKILIFFISSIFKVIKIPNKIKELFTKKIKII